MIFAVVGNSLDAVVESETSGDFRTLLVRLLQVGFRSFQSVMSECLNV